MRNFTEFWVATAAAAPVIALAAVVALPDLTTAEFEVVKRLYDKAIADGVKDAALRFVNFNRHAVGRWPQRLSGTLRQ